MLKLSTDSTQRLLGDPEIGGDIPKRNPLNDVRHLM